MTLTTHLKRCSMLALVVLCIGACTDDNTMPMITSNGTTSASNGTATSNGTVSTSNGTTSASNGTASNETGDFLIGNCDPDQENNCPVISCEDGDCVGICEPSPSSRVNLAACRTEYPREGCPEDSEDSFVGCDTHTDCIDGNGNQGYCNGNVQCGGAGCFCTANCRHDTCEADTDCANDEICLHRGVFGATINACIPFRCSTDADCNAEEGGECRLLGNSIFPAVVCTYPSDVCRSNSDCPTTCGNSVCHPGMEQNDGRSSKLSEPVVLQCYDDETCILP